MPIKQLSQIDFAYVALLCEYGVGCLTIASDVIENLIKNANVTSAVNDFVADFESLCGPGMTMLNCDTCSDEK